MYSVCLCCLKETYVQILHVFQQYAFTSTAFFTRQYHIERIFNFLGTCRKCGKMTVLAICIVLSHIKKWAIY